jgi:hypothetical protein
MTVIVGAAADGLPQRSPKSRGGWRILLLCSVVWPSEARLTDNVGRQPVPWTRHPHCCGVRRFVSTIESVVLVSFCLKSTGSCVVAESPVVRRQPLITVEDVAMGLR